MSVYSYPESKVVDAVTFRKTSGGALRAYLHARPDSENHALHDIIATFKKRGWQATPYSLDDTPLLEVRGFKNEQQLLGALGQQQWVGGALRRQDEPEDHVSFKDKIKKRSLFASGWFYLVGDAKFFSYGLKGNSPLDMAAGIFYGAGTLSSLLFGRKDPSDLQIHDIAKQMSDYMQQQNIALPPEASLTHIANDHQKGFIQKADDLLRRYPAELMNSFFALAGVCIAVAAYKNKVRVPMAPEMVEQHLAKKLGTMRKDFPHLQISPGDMVRYRQEATEKLKKFHHAAGWLDVGLGSMTVASGMFANFVKEKAPDPDAPKKEGMEAAWQWVQQHPMSVAGIGYMVSTLCHAASTGIEWKIGTTEAKKAIFDRGIFVATNLIAELLVAMSSKGHGDGVVSDKSVDNTAVALAADLIVKQPAAMQENLINHVSTFLGRPDVLAMQDTKVREMLQVEVETLRKNPWVRAEGVVAERENSQEKPKAVAWQARVAAENGVAQPQMTA